MKKRKLSLLVACLFASQYGYAHDDVLVPEVEVKEALINPLPSTTTSIRDAKELEKLRVHTSDTAKLLDGEPGISLYQAGGVSSMPVIHGLADDRIRIKVDGMDLISACANHMNTPLSYIDPVNVSSIKVYSGVTPVSVGGDSIGGTIKVESTAPQFSNSSDTLIHQGQIGTFYRSNNDARGANLSATLANDSFSARYTGSIVEANNYKAGDNFKAAGPAYTGGHWLNGDVVGSSAYKSENHALNLAFKRDNHLFDFKFGIQNIPYQGFPNQRMDMTRNDSEQFNFKYTSEYSWGNLVANVYHENTRHSMNFERDKQFQYGTAPGMPMETRGKNTGASLKVDIPYSDRDLFKVGAEYQRYRLDDWWPASGTSGMMQPYTFKNINNGQRDHYDAFAEWEAKWSKEWMTQLGLRHSTVEMNAGNVHGYTGMGNETSAANEFNAVGHQKTDQNLDATALARFTPNETSIYEFGYSIKNRSPNLYERYTWAYTSTMDMNMNNWVGDGNGYVGNINLKPETAHTFSVMGEWHDANHEKWNLRVSPYYSYVDDYIDATFCSNVYSGCVYTRSDSFRNLSLTNQSARLYGADISGRWLLGSMENFGAFKVSGVMSYVDGRNETTHDNLYNIMPLNAKLSLEQKLGGWTNVAEVKLVSEKDDLQAVRKELRTPGYGLLNLYSSYEWKQVRFDVGVENVFDKLYYHPLGGAYVGQGATMGTGVTYGTSVPGMGRSINVGLTLKF